MTGETHERRRHEVSGHRRLGAARCPDVEEAPQGTSTVNATMFESALALPALNE